MVDVDGCIAESEVVFVWADGLDVGSRRGGWLLEFEPELDNRDRIQKVDGWVQKVRAQSKQALV